MSILAGDPLTRLAFSVYENPGVFALLLGSGLSRAAEIPTGWEITLDLVRRVALARGFEEQPDWAAWYREQAGEEPDYSRLLEELAASPEERRSILHSYIEPDEEDRDEGRKVPTAAHLAIAELVRAGYIRVIITTNFDRLLENALRERGIEPTIVASVDALKGSEPITHSKCYILKLHGDYKDARILNTEAELDGYPVEYDTLLDRIFDEFGLIVCGWSGEWDHALRAALLRAPNRRYPTFWTYLGQTRQNAQELINHRHSVQIQITSSDNLFSELKEKILALKANYRENPVGAALLISRTKRLLRKSEYLIELSDLVSDEVRRVVKVMNGEEFDAFGSCKRSDFISRACRYEGILEPLVCVVGVMGRWGDDTEYQIFDEILSALFESSRKAKKGNLSLLELRTYPIVLIGTSYALGLIQASRYSTLRRMLGREFYDGSRDIRAKFIDRCFVTSWGYNYRDLWQPAENSRLNTPFNDRVCQMFINWFEQLTDITPNAELTFETFEILGALYYFERYNEVEIKKWFADRQGHGIAPMPTGRVGWHSQSTRFMISNLQEGSLRYLLIRSGFAQSNESFLDLFIENFKRHASRMWW